MRQRPWMVWCELPAWSFPAISAGVILGLSLWCLWYVVGRVPQMYSVSDTALTELYTVHASRGVSGLGPYSRFGWHHPGPMYFYLLVPYYLLSGQHGLGLQAGALAINLLALVALVGTLYRHASGGLMAAAVATVAIYLSRVLPLLTSTWNPHVLVLPYATFIIVAAVTSSGRLSLLPLTVTLASFITQTHVGLAPSAMILLALAIVVGLLRQSRSAAASPGRHSAAYWLAVSGGVAVTCWGPVLYHELTTSPSNLAAMGRFFVTTNSARLPFDEALTAWARIMTAPFRPGFALAEGHVVPIAASTWMVCLAVGEVVLLWIAGRWSAANGRAVDAWICRLSGLAALLALASIASVRGGLMDHLIFWISIVGALNIGVLAGLGWVWAGSRLRRPVSPVWSAAARAGIAFAVIGLVGMLGVNRLERERYALMSRTELPPVGRLYQTTRHAIAGSLLRRPLIEVRIAWEDAASIILQLHKHYVSFGVERGYAWMFGAPIAARGDEDGVITIANHEFSRQLIQDPQDCVIALTSKTVVHFRFPLSQRRDKLACISLPLD